MLVSVQPYGWKNHEDCGSTLDHALELSNGKGTRKVMYAASVRVCSACTLVLPALLILDSVCCWEKEGLNAGALLTLFWG